MTLPVYLILLTIGCLLSLAGAFAAGCVIVVALLCSVHTPKVRVTVLQPSPDPG